MATASRADGPYSWVVAVACCWVTFVIQGLVRSAGVIYVSLIDTYEVNRGQASWPFTIRVAIWNMIGPVTGALSYRWSTRSITIVGILVVTVGNIMCWIAEDINVIIICLGVIQGIGIGMAVTLIPVIINQYFVKYKTTGAGIACAGATIGSFALPPIVEFTIEEYGLRGAFLVMAGITLHGVLGAALLRPAFWLQKKTPKAKKKERDSAYVSISGSVIPPEVRNDEVKCTEVFEPPVNPKELRTCGSGIHRVSNYTNTETQKFCQQYTQTDNHEAPVQNNVRDTADETKNLLDQNVPDHVICVSTNDRQACANLPGLEDTNHRDVAENGRLKFLDTEDNEKTNSNDETHLMLDAVTPTINKSGKNRRWTCLSGFKEPARAAWSIICNPMFLIITSNYCIFFLSYMTYLVVIVDYSLDLGVDKTNSVFLVSTFSITDLCGRLGSGWITDSGFVKRKNLVMFSMVTLGALLAGTSVAKTYVSLMAVSVSAGLVVGINLIVFYALLEEYLGIQKMAMAVGLMNFTIGPVSLVTPLLTGYFRDSLGSYDHLFHLIGVLLIACGLSWTAEPYYMRYKERREAQTRPTTS